MALLPVSPAVLGRLQVLAAAALFSTGGAGLKADTFSVMQLSGLRSATAAVVLLLWVRRRVPLTPATLAGAVMYAATVTLFVAATKLTTAANAIFIQSAAPFFLILLGPWLLHERLRRRDVPFVLALFAGMGLAFAGTPAATATAPDPATGNLVAAACSLTWALTLVALRHLERGRAAPGDGLAVVLLGNLLAAALAVPFLLPLPAAEPRDWAVVAYLGIVQIAAAYVLLTRAMRRVPAMDASLLLLLEPVLNPIWTWLAHGESPGWGAVIGGGTIIVATALQVLRDRQPPRLPPT